MGLAGCENVTKHFNRADQAAAFLSLVINLSRF
jgi:hypothetical protein